MRRWQLWWLLLLPGLLQAQDRPYLDVSIEAFAAAPVPAQAPAVTEADAAAAAATLQAITPQIRNAEARYLSLYLRYRLEASGLYGAVRVLPEVAPGADLTVRGRILESDGAVLALHLTVQDSSGAIWLDSDFRGSASPSTSLNANALLDDDFAALFSAILRDLQQQLEQHTPQQLTAIKQQALLHYGASLVPQYFERFFTLRSDGSAELVRLPAADDPLLQRITTIREREYIFVDVVDQQYRHFFAELRPVYQMWRNFRREQADSAVRVQERENANQFSRGSYYALQESYNNYRWAKLQELYLDELSEGFANEAEPTQIELDDSLFRLTGTMSQQYREWRSILAELLALELQEAPANAR